MASTEVELITVPLEVIYRFASAEIVYLLEQAMNELSLTTPRVTEMLNADLQWQDVKKKIVKEHQGETWME